MLAMLVVVFLLISYAFRLTLLTALETLVILFGLLIGFAVAKA